MDDYEKKLEWYRNQIERDKNSKSRQVQDYVDYLERWFDPNGKCDGATYKDRIAWKRTPMSYIEYTLG